MDGRESINMGTFKMGEPQTELVQGFLTIVLEHKSKPLPELFKVGLPRLQLSNISPFTAKSSGVEGRQSQYLCFIETSKIKKN